MSTETPPPPTPLPPIESLSIPYATASTNRELDRQSLDRAMTVRLSRTLGMGLLCLGCILGFLYLILLVRAGTALSNRVSYIAIGAIGGIYLLPGILLLSFYDQIRTSRSAGPIIFVLIVSLWLVLGFGLSAIGSALMVLNDLDASRFLMNAVVSGIFLIATGKLVYHVIRVLALRGAGSGTAADIVSVRERIGGLRAGTPNGARPVLIVGAVANVIVMLFAAVCLTLSFMHPTGFVSPARKPPTMIVSPSRAAVTPYTGDVFDAQRGLPSGDRTLILDCVEQRRSLGVHDRDFIDEILRERGRALVGGITRPLTADDLPQILPTAAPAENISGKSVKRAVDPNAIRFPDGGAIVLMGAGGAGLELHDSRVARVFGRAWQNFEDGRQCLQFLEIETLLHEAMTKSRRSITEPQAISFTTAARGQTAPVSIVSPNAPTRAMISSGDVAISADGELGLALPRLQVWFVSNGAGFDTSTAAIAEADRFAAAAYAARRILPMSSSSALVLLLDRIAALLLAAMPFATIVGEGRVWTWTRWAHVKLALLPISTAIGLWFMSSFADAIDWRWKNLLDPVLFIIAIFVFVAWMLLAVLPPLTLLKQSRRNISDRAAMS